MQLNIKYYGLLAEITDVPEETIQFSGSTVSDALDILFIKYPKLKLKDFKVAMNQQIVTKEANIINEELALLPPFSGG